MTFIDYCYRISRKEQSDCGRFALFTTLPSQASPRCAVLLRPHYELRIALPTVERGYSRMTPQNSTDWKHLAEQASKEMDPEKLMSLVNELNRVLEQNEKSSRGRTEENIRTVV